MPMVAQHRKLAWYLCDFFMGSGSVLLRNPILLRFFRGGRGPDSLFPTLDPHMDVAVAYNAKFIISQEGEFYNIFKKFLHWIAIVDM